MYKKPRVIPCLLIEDGSLVKTKKFKERTYIGDPINAVKIFNEKEADELCLLDISSHKNRAIDFPLLENIASEAFMPLSYGGGIRSLEDAKRLFRIGFEKVIFNTALMEDKELVKETAAFAGSQSVVASIDIKRNFFGGLDCYIDCGTKKAGRGCLEYLEEIEKLDVGEIFLNSIDCDGMMGGYDFSAIKSITEKTNLPVISCGGAGSLADLAKAVKDGGAHAAAAGSLFVYYGPRHAVLINYPTEQEQREAGLFA